MERDTTLAARLACAEAEVDPNTAAAGAAGDAAGRADSEAAAGSPIGPSDRYARNLAETSGAMFLYGSMNGVFREADALAFKLYRDRLVADCGSPHDPVEIMLIEQLALAHLNAGRLHFKAANAESLDGARVYGGLAVLLQGELRRTALALKVYRSQVRPQGVASEVVHGGAGDAASRHSRGAATKPPRRRTG